MSNQVYANGTDPYWLSANGVNQIYMNKLNAPPLALLDKGVLYELDDGILYFNGTGLNPTAIGNVTGPASSTVGNLVQWNNTSGTLVANSTVPISSVMTLNNPQTVTGVKTFTASPVISTITNTGTLTLPTATDTLVARTTTDTLTNKTITGNTNTVDANALKTTGASVTVNASAPPSTGYILTTTSATNATWQLPSYVNGPASATDNALARFNSTTGKLIKNSGWLLGDDNRFRQTGTLNLLMTAEDTNRITALGINAGPSTLTSTSDDVFIGFVAGQAANASQNVTAVGARALQATTSGNINQTTAIGSYALYQLVDGVGNTAVGYLSARELLSGSGFNTFLGHQSAVNLVNGSYNIILGYNSGSNLATSTASNNNIYIGSVGPSSSGSVESNTIRIGSTQTSCIVKGINSGSNTNSVQCSSTGTLSCNSPIQFCELYSTATFFSPTVLNSPQPFGDTGQVSLLSSVSLFSASGTSGLIVYNGPGTRQIKCIFTATFKGAQDLEFTINKNGTAFYRIRQKGIGAGDYNNVCLIFTLDAVIPTDQLQIYINNHTDSNPVEFFAQSFIAEVAY